MKLLHLLSVYHDLFFLAGVLVIVGAVILSLVRFLFFSKKEVYYEEGSNVPSVLPTGKPAGNDSDFSYDPPVRGDRVGYRRRRHGCLKLLGATFLCFVVKRGEWFARLRRRRDGRGPEFLVPFAQLVRL